MKKILVTIALAFVCISTSAQGTIFFNNRTSTGDVRIYAPDGVSGFGTLPNAQAQLFLIPSGGGTPVPLLPATTFRTGVASFFVNPVDVTVPGVPAGTAATVILRAWSGTDYATALISGESAPLTISALGGVNPVTGAIVPTPDLSGLVVPEPTALALGLLGAAALLYRRRN